MPDAILGFYLFAALASAFVASWALTSALASRGFLSSDWEVRALASAALMGCMLVMVVELTSLFHAISSFGLATAWLALSAALFGLKTKLGKRTSTGRAEVTPPDPNFFGPEERLILFTSGLIVLILFLLAILTPPTSWDSFTYHLPRVLSWIQNGSVAPFATHDTRQVESGPFAAFAVMQLYLVTQSDRLVNLVQWGAMILSAVGVTWLTRQIPAQSKIDTMGAERSSLKARAWATLFAVTMPVGIVQSITTQTDYVIALWVVATAVFGFLLCREPSNPVYAVLFGAALALGTITKATMVVTAGLLGVCVVFFALRATTSNLARIRMVLLIALVGTLTVAPHFTRNLRVFGSPLGSRYIYALMRNEYQAPSIWISNFFRNLSLHAASGVPAITSTVNKLLSFGQSLSGRPENDRASTFFTSTFNYINGYPVSDNSAGNFWHALVALLGSISLLVRFPPIRKWAALALGIVSITFVLQNAYLRWTEWNARFHLPLFLLLAPLAGISLARSPAALRIPAGLILAIVGCHAALFNKSRPVLGENDFLFQDRERQYFIEVPNLYRPSLNAVTDVIASGSTNMGLRMYRDFFQYLDEMEYPFWMLLRNRGFTGKIYHVGMTNQTARLSNSVPIEALISSTRGPQAEVAHVFPYLLKYPPIDVYCSESASHWAQLAQISEDSAERPFHENPNVLELNDNAAVLSCRVARQGVLSLNIAIVRNESLLEQPTALLARSFAGFLRASQSTNARHSLEVPLPPGQTAVQFGVPTARDPALKLAVQWKWQPVDDPLPFVFISRIYAPTNTSGAGTNALLLPAGALRNLQLISGANGEVQVEFFAKTTNHAELTLAADSAPTRLLFTNGVCAVRLAVNRGTNQFTLQNNSTVEIPLDRVDATFR